MSMSPTPVYIDDGVVVPLARVNLGKGLKNEGWLQDLLFQHPAMLPIAELEHGFGEPVPAAREVACGHGFIDNLYLTPSGEIIIVEVKLWSNPQARREVVAQALDYAAAVARMSYQAFETAVLAKAPGVKSLHALVADHADALDEAAFCDAVSANLARGRMLVLAVGDGVRREAEALADLLQSHAGAHFRFALVEMAAYRVPESERYMVVPRILLKTHNVERGVVRIEDGRAVVGPSAMPGDAAAPSVTAATLSEGMFIDLMNAATPGLGDAIRAFVDSVAPMGVIADYGKTLHLRLPRANASQLASLGYIQKDGRFVTQAVEWYEPAEVARPYLETLAAAIGGVVAPPDGYSGSRVTTNGKTSPVIAQLLPQHADIWRDAIAAFAQRMHAGEAVLAEIAR